jgi:hypothetical protein
MDGTKNTYRVLVEKSKGDHVEDVGNVGTIILKWILRIFNAKMWAGLIWFRTETRGGLLRRQKSIFGLHKMRRNS